jgi:AraC-like DNA-binding protein
MQENMLSFSFLIAAFGQIILVLSLLSVRLKSASIYTPLALFFLASGLSFTFPAINSIWPNFSIVSMFIILPCIGVQPIALWLYVVGLTSPTRWQLNIRYWKHFIPALLGGGLTLVMLFAPLPLISEIFIDGKEPDSSLGLFIIVSFLILMIVFLVQFTCYLIAIVKRLLRYQSQLKLLFSSNEHRELVWVLWLVFIIAGTWITTLVYFLPTVIGKKSLFGDEVITACYFVLIWTLAMWGLRQKPGFHGRYINETEDHDISQTIEELIVPKNIKYQRSALGKTQSQSIVKKLEQAMENQQLYLQSNLSLTSLAKYICVPANYVSQTLNENLNESFFDYVNRWRVEHSKLLLIERQQTVLDIAMNSGFNAKSSFYKAFKKNTGQTPGQFIKSN